MQLAPGDYVSSLEANPKISKERIDELRRQFGLDKSWLEQFGLWLWNILTRGDFGTSFSYNRSVASLLWERVPATLLMAIASLICNLGDRYPLRHHRRRQAKSPLRPDFASLKLPRTRISQFHCRSVFTVLCPNHHPPISRRWYDQHLSHRPLPNWEKIIDIGWHLILPTIALSVTGFAGLQRITRGEMLDVLRQDYIQTARAKGLPENRVIYVHALRNAVNPLITLLGFELASLLSGAFITEQFFNWPGLGKLTLQALFNLDVPLAMASLVMGAVLLIVGNLVADLMLKAADPRIRSRKFKLVSYRALGIGHWALGIGHW